MNLLKTDEVLSFKFVSKLINLQLNGQMCGKDLCLKFKTVETILCTSDLQNYQYIEHAECLLTLLPRTNLY